MNINEYAQEKQEFDTQNASFIENELAILEHIEQLHGLLEIRQPLAEKLNANYSRLKRAANELKTGDSIKFAPLILIGTFGDIVKAWMDRYYDRKFGGHDLSYERLIAIRAEPREKPGKRYDSTGQEINLKKRKVLVEGGSMTDAIKKLTRW